MTFATVIKWCKDEGINIDNSKSLISIVDKYPIIPIDLTYNNSKTPFNDNNVNTIYKEKLLPELYDNNLTNWSDMDKKG